MNINFFNKDKMIIFFTDDQNHLKKMCNHHKNIIYFQEDNII